MYKITPNSKLYLGGVAAALLSLSSPALAEPRQLEEVIVLAQKRAQNLQDVPIAVSAFDNETLVAANVKTTLDLPLRVPSLSIPVTNGFARVSMRGVTNTNSQPQVSYCQIWCMTNSSSGAPVI